MHGDACKGNQNIEKRGKEMDRKEIKLWAKERTRGNKWNVWMGYLTVTLANFVMGFTLMILFALVVYAVDPIYSDSFTPMEYAMLVTMFVLYVFAMGFSVSVYNYVKRIVIDNNANLSNLKASITQYFKQGFGVLLMGIIIAFGLFAFVIPGIYLMMAFAMVPYLLSTNHKMGIMEAMQSSWRMMAGRKAELAVLFLSFYGWVFAGAFTLGILYIWLLPYMSLTFIKYFVEIENKYYGIVSEPVVFENNKDIEEFALLNNLKIDNHNNVYGMFNNYPVVVMFAAPGDLMITIKAAVSERSSLDEYFIDIQTVLTNLKSISYNDGIITMEVTRNEELHEVYEVINRITLKLKDLDVYPCCSNCHLDKPTSFYQYHNQLVNLCDDCKNMITNQEDEVIENSPKGIIGALAGALIGGAAWVLVSQLGVIASIVGYLIVYLSIRGYEMLAGRISKKGLIICVVCSVLALIAAEYVCLGIEIMDLVSLNNIFNAFSMIPYFLSFSEVAGVVLKDVIIGLIFMAIASFQLVSKINKSLDEQTLNKMD